MQAFWILHIKFSASALPTNNVAIKAEVSAESHPFLTGAKFVPFKTARPENAAKLQPISSINTASAQVQHSAVNNGPDQNPISGVQNLLPLNSLSTELLDQFSLLPNFEPKKVSSTKNGSFLPTQNKNVADSATLTGIIDADNNNVAKLAAAVKLPPFNVADLTNVVANDAAKLISDATLLPVPVGGLKSVGANVSGQLIPSAFLSSVSVDELKNAESNPLPPDAEFKNTLPFPNLAFDQQIAVSRKLIPPELVSFSFQQPAPLHLSERITLPRQSPAGEAPQAKNLLPIPSNLPADVKLVPIPTQKVPAAAAKLATEILPPKEESLAELIDTLSSGGYGVLASQMAAVINASTVKEDLPLIFQRLTAQQKAAHSPKKDVEVFAPLQPEKPAQPPFQPGIPAFPPQYPFSPDGGAYPSDETPFVVNNYPAYPPFSPEEPPTEKPFMPHFPTLLPTTRSTEEVTRPTEDTTRATEETTPKLPKTTPTEHKFTPWVPKNTPSVPKNTPWVSKNTPWVSKNTPVAPKYTPPRQPPMYTPDASGHSWITRFYPGYPPTTKLPKGMPSPIWPMFTPRPTIPPQRSNQADMVTPFMEKLISATSTAATPSVQVLGEPSAVEPKYKLAVVSDYKNYDMKDGSFGFR